MFEEGLVTKLTADVAALGGRIHPQYLPQGSTLPAVSYRLLADPLLDAHDGPTDLIDATMMLTIWGATYSSLKSTAQAVRDSLAGFSGTLGSTEVSRIAWLGASESFDQTGTQDDDSPGVHRQDATITIQRKKEV